MIKNIIIGFILLLVSFVWWRYTSVKRGVLKRDKELLKHLQPIGEKLESGQVISKNEVANIAKFPENRPILYEMLKKYNRLDLFPEQYLSIEAQAESDLALWLSHPNELQKAPDEIKLLEKISKEVNGDTIDFYVFQFKTDDPHWAAKDGWMIGVSGPYAKKSAAYVGAPGTFSNLEKIKDKTPAEMLDWVQENILKNS